MKLFVPLWHMPERGVSGGLYRTKRLLETMRSYELIVADSDTSDLDASMIRGRIVCYPARRLYAFHQTLFPAFRVLNWLWSCLALAAIGLRADLIDAVYVPNSELPHVSLAAWIVGKTRRIPIVYGNLNVRGTEFWALNRWLHRQADAIVTLSNALASELKTEGIDVPVFVGSVGVDDHRPAAALPIVYDGIYIARHTEEKGVFDMLEIARSCADRMPNIRIAMVGPCSDAMRRRLTAAIRRHRIVRNIDLLGAVSEEEKWRLLAQSRICLFPSRVEGWGIVPIEAHLCGLPVIAYDLPAYEETIRHSPAATLVPVGDADAFADAVHDALSAGVPRRDDARAWAQQFTWERAAQIEERLIAQILQPSETLSAEAG